MLGHGFLHGARVLAHELDVSSIAVVYPDTADNGFHLGQWGMGVRMRLRMTMRMGLCMLMGTITNISLRTSRSVYMSARSGRRISLRYECETGCDYEDG